MTNRMFDGNAYPTGPLVAVSLPELLLSDNKFCNYSQEYEEFYIENVRVRVKFNTGFDDETIKVKGAEAPYMYTKIDSNGPLNVVRSEFNIANSTKYKQAEVVDGKETYKTIPYSMFIDVTAGERAFNINTYDNTTGIKISTGASIEVMNPILDGSSILWVMCPGYNFELHNYDPYRYCMKSWIEPVAAEFNPMELRLGSDVYSRARHYANYPRPGTEWAELEERKTITEIDLAEIPYFNGEPSYTVENRTRAGVYEVFSDSTALASRYIYSDTLENYLDEECGISTTMPNPWMYFIMKTPTYFTTTGNANVDRNNEAYITSVFMTVTYTVEFKGISEINTAGISVHTNPPLLAENAVIGPGNPPDPAPEEGAAFVNNRIGLNVAAAVPERAIEAASGLPSNSGFIGASGPSTYSMAIPSGSRVIPNRYVMKDTSGGPVMVDTAVQMSDVKVGETSADVPHVTPFAPEEYEDDEPLPGETTPIVSVHADERFFRLDSDGHVPLSDDESIEVATDLSMAFKEVVFMFHWVSNDADYNIWSDYNTADDATKKLITGYVESVTSRIFMAAKINATMLSVLTPYNLVNDNLMGYFTNVVPTDGLTPEEVDVARMYPTYVRAIEVFADYDIPPECTNYVDRNEGILHVSAGSIIYNPKPVIFEFFKNYLPTVDYESSVELMYKYSVFLYTLPLEVAKIPLLRADPDATIVAEFADNMTLLWTYVITETRTYTSEFVYLERAPYSDYEPPEDAADEEEVRSTVWDASVTEPNIPRPPRPEQGAEYAEVPPPNDNNREEVETSDGIVETNEEVGGGSVYTTEELIVENLSNITYVNCVQLDPALYEIYFKNTGPYWYYSGGKYRHSSLGYLKDPASWASTRIAYVFAADHGVAPLTETLNGGLLAYLNYEKGLFCDDENFNEGVGRYCTTCIIPYRCVENPETAGFITIPRGKYNAVEARSRVDGEPEPFYVVYNSLVDFEIYPLFNYVPNNINPIVRDDPRPPTPPPPVDVDEPNYISTILQTDFTFVEGGENTTVHMNYNEVFSKVLYPMMIKNTVDNKFTEFMQSIDLTGVYDYELFYERFAESEVWELFTNVGFLRTPSVFMALMYPEMFLKPNLRGYFCNYISSFVPLPNGFNEDGWFYSMPRAIMLNRSVTLSSTHDGEEVSVVDVEPGTLILHPTPVFMDNLFNLYGTLPDVEQLWYSNALWVFTFNYGYETEEELVSLVSEKIGKVGIGVIDAYKYLIEHPGVELFFTDYREYSTLNVKTGKYMVPADVDSVFPEVGVGIEGLYRDVSAWTTTVLYSENTSAPRYDTFSNEMTSLSELASVSISNLNLLNYADDLGEGYVTWDNVSLEGVNVLGTLIKPNSSRNIVMPFLYTTTAEGNVIGTPGEYLYSIGWQEMWNYEAKEGVAIDGLWISGFMPAVIENGNADLNKKVFVALTPYGEFDGVTYKPHFVDPDNVSAFALPDIAYVGPHEPVDPDDPVVERNSYMRYTASLNMGVVVDGITTYYNMSVSNALSNMVFPFALRIKNEDYSYLFWGDGEDTDVEGAAMFDTATDNLRSLFTPIYYGEGNMCTAFFMPEGLPYGFDETSPGTFGSSTFAGYLANSCTSLETTWLRYNFSDMYPGFEIMAAWFYSMPRGIIVPRTETVVYGKEGSETAITYTAGEFIFLPSPGLLNALLETPAYNWSPEDAPYENGLWILTFAFKLDELILTAVGDEEADVARYANFWESLYRLADSSANGNLTFVNNIINVSKMEYVEYKYLERALDDGDDLRPMPGSTLMGIPEPAANEVVASVSDETIGEENLTEPFNVSYLYEEFMVTENITFTYYDVLHNAEFDFKEDYEARLSDIFVLNNNEGGESYHAEFEDGRFSFGGFFTTSGPGGKIINNNHVMFPMMYGNGPNFEGKQNETFYEYMPTYIDGRYLPEGEDEYVYNKNLSICCLEIPFEGEDFEGDNYLSEWFRLYLGIMEGDVEETIEYACDYFPSLTYVGPDIIEDPNPPDPGPEYKTLTSSANGFAFGVSNAVDAVEEVNVEVSNSFLICRMAFGIIFNNTEGGLDFLIEESPAEATPEELTIAKNTYNVYKEYFDFNVNMSTLTYMPGYMFRSHSIAGYFSNSREEEVEGDKFSRDWWTSLPRVLMTLRTAEANVLVRPAEDGSTPIYSKVTLPAGTFILMPSAKFMESFYPPKDDDRFVEDDLKYEAGVWVFTLSFDIPREEMTRLRELLGDTPVGDVEDTLLFWRDIYKLQALTDLELYVISWFESLVIKYKQYTYKQVVEGGATDVYPTFGAELGGVPSSIAMLDIAVEEGDRDEVLNYAWLFDENYTYNSVMNPNDRELTMFNVFAGDTIETDWWKLEAAEFLSFYDSNAAQWVEFRPYNYANDLSSSLWETELNFTTEPGRLTLSNTGETFYLFAFGEESFWNLHDESIDESYIRLYEYLPVLVDKYLPDNEVELVAGFLELWVRPWVTGYEAFSFEKNEELMIIPFVADPEPGPGKEGKRVETLAYGNVFNYGEYKYELGSKDIDEEENFEVIISPSYSVENVLLPYVGGVKLGESLDFVWSGEYVLSPEEDKFVWATFRTLSEFYSMKDHECVMSYIPYYMLMSPYTSGYFLNRSFSGSVIVSNDWFYSLPRAIMVLKAYNIKTRPSSISGYTNIELSPGTVIFMPSYNLLRLLFVGERSFDSYSFNESEMEYYNGVWCFTMNIRQEHINAGYLRGLTDYVVSYRDAYYVMERFYSLEASKDYSDAFVETEQMFVYEVLSYERFVYQEVFEGERINEYVFDYPEDRLYGIPSFNAFDEKELVMSEEEEQSVFFEPFDFTYAYNTFVNPGNNECVYANILKLEPEMFNLIFEDEEYFYRLYNGEGEKLSLEGENGVYKTELFFTEFPEESLLFANNAEGLSLYPLCFGDERFWDFLHVESYGSYEEFGFILPVLLYVEHLKKVCEGFLVYSLLRVDCQDGFTGSDLVSKMRMYYAHDDEYELYGSYGLSKLTAEEYLGYDDDDGGESISYSLVSFVKPVEEHLEPVSVSLNGFDIENYFDIRECVVSLVYLRTVGFNWNTLMSTNTEHFGDTLCPESVSSDAVSSGFTPARSMVALTAMQFVYEWNKALKDGSSFITYVPMCFMQMVYSDSPTLKSNEIYTWVAAMMFGCYASQAVYTFEEKAECPNIYSLPRIIVPTVSGVYYRTYEDREVANGVFYKAGDFIVFPSPYVVLELVAEHSKKLLRLHVDYINNAKVDSIYYYKEDDGSSVLYTKGESFEEEYREDFGGFYVITINPGAVIDYELRVIRDASEIDFNEVVDIILNVVYGKASWYSCVLSSPVKGSTVKAHFYDTSYGVEEMDIPFVPLTPEYGTPESHEAAGVSERFSTISALEYNYGEVNNIMLTPFKDYSFYYIDRNSDLYRKYYNAEVYGAFDQYCLSQGYNDDSGDVYFSVKYLSRIFSSYFFEYLYSSGMTKPVQERWLESVVEFDLLKESYIVGGEDIKEFYESYYNENFKYPFYLQSNFVHGESHIKINYTSSETDGYGPVAYLGISDYPNMLGKVRINFDFTNVYMPEYRTLGDLLPTDFRYAFFTAPFSLNINGDKVEEVYNKREDSYQESYFCFEDCIIPIYDVHLRCFYLLVLEYPTSYLIHCIDEGHESAWSVERLYRFSEPTSEIIWSMPKTWTLKSEVVTYNELWLYDADKNLLPTDVWSDTLLWARGED